jgi:hypothetical protein
VPDTASYRFDGKKKKAGEVTFLTLLSAHKGRPTCFAEKPA